MKKFFQEPCRQHCSRIHRLEPACCRKATAPQLEAEVVSVIAGSQDLKLAALPYARAIRVPVPYLYWVESKAILVAANASSSRDVQLKLHILLNEIGFVGRASYIRSPAFGV